MFAAPGVGALIALMVTGHRLDASRTMDVRRIAVVWRFQGMQMIVRSDSTTIVRQARAYAEYRMFAAVGKFGSPGDRLSVQLDRLDEVGRQYRCEVTLNLNRVGRIRAQASAERLFAAIDQTAERLADRVTLRLSALRWKPES
jgi:ribosomal subunit interface protein